MKGFIQARAMWLSSCAEKENQFVGFYTKIMPGNVDFIHIHLAARTYYRLFVNGRMIAHGPARAGEGFCRIDRLTVPASKEMDIAVEVAAYSLPERYCNDHTMEPGMLACEITERDGQVVSFTGDNAWRCVELTQRRSRVETMSHCRGILEWYDLTPESFDWRRGEGAVFQVPTSVVTEPSYLERRSPFPDYRIIPAMRLLRVSGLRSVENAPLPPLYHLARQLHPVWHAAIPPENHLLAALASEEECEFDGDWSQTEMAEGEQIVNLRLDGESAALTWAMEHTEVGFVRLKIETATECTLDLLCADHLNDRGEVSANTFPVRWALAPGKYDLTTFEPKLARFLRLNVRSQGTVTIQTPRLISYTYHDVSPAYFHCSDHNLNHIYDAARRTLRLNTLDIFMDCPERERGGWLCDSWFTARAAWQMLGDLSVERDFLENFLLTDASRFEHGFFPEVYPGVHAHPSEVGILNWSFWLLLELADYYDRSGDKSFIEQCRERVASCVEGMLSLRGVSGLMENLKPVFVDWSLSNTPAATEPISVPVNCLAVRALKAMAELYGCAQWAEAAEQMRKRIEELNTDGGDAAAFTDDALHRQGIRTEGGIALELWGGFHRDCRPFMQRFLSGMGPDPEQIPDPNIASANLFIGLMTRFAVLAEMGQIARLVREWKAVYLPQLGLGADTLFETVQERHGCHGFNAAVGAMMTQQILGLGQPSERTRSVMISPHVCGLQWAEGAARVKDGMIYMRWVADPETQTLAITIRLPRDWRYTFVRARELSGWRITINGQALNQ